MPGFAIRCAFERHCAVGLQPFQFWSFRKSYKQLMKYSKPQEFMFLLKRFIKLKQIVNGLVKAARIFLLLWLSSMLHVKHSYRGASFRFFHNQYLISLWSNTTAVKSIHYITTDPKSQSICCISLHMVSSPIAFSRMQWLPPWACFF